ncbi:hypothetical protein [Sphingobacterium gobiense]|uniref:Uncharacterized protein n=1 Tax=Sphingobacterium gobiense TaxID=1382456 RepID=A0A2S9JU77_9SPHI|nr:hypothetical protein [Sphingobacterium gobiense]PRD56814.1 hypothetical protein C5749_06210 [Sphingobacterium gobiense]
MENKEKYYDSSVLMLPKQKTPAGRRKDTLLPNPKNTFGLRQSINGYAVVDTYPPNVKSLLFSTKSLLYGKP